MDELFNNFLNIFMNTNEHNNNRYRRRNNIVTPNIDFNDMFNLFVEGINSTPLTRSQYYLGRQTAVYENDHWNYNTNHLSDQYNYNNEIDEIINDDENSIYIDDQNDNIYDEENDYSFRLNQNILHNTRILRQFLQEDRDYDNISLPNEDVRTFRNNLQSQMQQRLQSQMQQRLQTYIRQLTQQQQQQTPIQPQIYTRTQQIETQTQPQSHIQPQIEIQTQAQNLYPSIYGYSEVIEELPISGQTLRLFNLRPHVSNNTGTILQQNMESLENLDTRRDNFNPVSIFSENLLNAILSGWNFQQDFTDILINSLENEINTFEDVKVTLSEQEFNEITDKQNKAEGVCNICLEDFNIISDPNNKLENEDTQKNKTIEPKGEDYTEGEIKNINEIVSLKCNHSYHKECIYKWLTQQSTKCPVCRHDCRETS